MAAAEDLKAASENLTAKTDDLKALLSTRDNIGKEIEDAKAAVESAKDEFGKASLAVQQEAHDLVLAS